MKRKVLILLITIIVFIILNLICYFILPITSNSIINRAVSGVLGLLSVGIAIFVVNRTTVKST